MKNVNSKLFKSFDKKTVDNNQLSRFKGGLASVDESRDTGMNDCTGDYITPDCGDGTSNSSDSVPTSRNDDGCY